MTALKLAAKFDPESKAIQQELTVLKQKSARDSLHEKNLYRKMLGTPKQEQNSENSTKKSTKSSTTKSKLAVWSLIGGTIVAVTGVIVYRLTF